MTRFTRTAEHLATPRARNDGSRPFPRQLLEHPTFVPRLSWKIGGQVPVASVHVARIIEQARGVAFFCDNSIFHDHLDPAILAALLAVPGRMVLTPLVMRELRPWLMARPEHQLTDAIKRAVARPREITIPERGQPGRTVYDYYVWLLLLRRNAFAVSNARFTKENGREPTESEKQALRDRVHEDLGPRGYLLARKGMGTLPTDEQLVVAAVENAVRTGQKTVVLTADADVEEQFFKLLWLIDTHYRGMHLAKRYAANFASMHPHRLPRELADDPSCPFEDDGTVLIDRGPSDLRHVLPRHAECVAVECWTMGRAHFSAMTFMAERGMAELLNVKDRTGGLSTDLLGGRNLHPWLAPLPMRNETGYAVVARDKRVTAPGSDASLARHDIAQSVTNLERHANFEGVAAGPVTILSAEGTPVRLSGTLAAE